MHEIIFNFVHLIKKIDPDDPDNGIKGPFYRWNLSSEFFYAIYIGTLLSLSGFTFSKLKIETRIYY